MIEEKKLRRQNRSYVSNVLWHDRLYNEILVKIISDVVLGSIQPEHEIIYVEFVCGKLCDVIESRMCTV